VRENSAYELSGRIESRRAADLPKDVAILSATAHYYGRAGRRNKGAHCLEHPDVTGRPGESKCSCQTSRGRKTIDAWPERRQQTEIRRTKSGIAPLECQIIIRSSGITLRLKRHRITYLLHSGHDPRRKTGGCNCARADTQVSGDDGRAGIGHRFSHYRESLRRTQWWRGRGHC